jgi:hypothetical protein
MRVFESRVLRKTFRLKKKEVAGGWRKMLIGYLHNLHSSANIRVIKSRKIRWAEPVARDCHT